MHKLFIIIPVHNRINLSRSCLSCLNEQTYNNFEVIIVDDGSTDGTYEMIKNDFPGVIILKGDGNLWWTGAINLGIEYIRKNSKDEDFILLLNNDTMMTGNYIANIISTAVRNKNSIIGSVVINQNDKKTIIDGGCKINWISAKFNVLNKGKKYNDVILNNTLISVDALSGRGILMPLEIFNKIGSFNFNSLPHYGADYEFSIRAKKNGYKLFIDYNAIVFTEDRHKNNNWLSLFRSFFSICSANNIKSRWRFAILICPWYLIPSFFLLDFFRVLSGSLRNQVKK